MENGIETWDTNEPADGLFEYSSRIEQLNSSGFAESHIETEFRIGTDTEHSRFTIAKTGFIGDEYISTQFNLTITERDLHGLLALIQAAIENIDSAK